MVRIKIMKKLIIITICCLFLFSCVTMKGSEVPNSALPTYIEKVKKDPLGEALDWWIVLDVLQDITFD